MKMYSEMSESEMLVWGAAEHDARIGDLAGVKSQEALQNAQANAERRRKSINASRSQASRMVTDASRARRWGTLPDAQAVRSEASEGEGRE